MVILGPMNRYLIMILVTLGFMMTCLIPRTGGDVADVKEKPVYYPSSKPCTRWWWFATRIQKPDIRYQLDWMKAMHFGGVEIAWVYPLYRYQKMYAERYNRHYPIDTSAQKWLSPEWAEVVAYTKAYADSIGLSCDFTFGSAWPVASPDPDPNYITQIYGDSLFRQVLTFSWSYPDTQWVINHLDARAFAKFAEPVGKALQPALQGSRSALFTDSWEIKLNAKNKIWTPGFDQAFQQQFGYDIVPYMDAGLDSFPDVRYDYMLLLDQLVTTGFYKPFAEKCTSLGAWSRVQCLASPTDVMTTYALVDIPETEAMLNDPVYSRIVSSSACLASKPLVSCEAFTCMYGFPATYLRQEQTADLKMVADALFAQGVNHLVYHGTPYNPQGSDTIDFFATTYFGPGGSLEPELPMFNRYIETVSGIMQEGHTYSDVAVYIPYEDAVMKGPYPPEKQRVWVWGEYEMRYIAPPAEIQGYHPLWINRHFLETGIMQDGKLRAGDARFSALYVDVEYMDIRALRRILQLAREGFPVCLKKRPRQPGQVKSAEFQEMLDALLKCSKVSQQWKDVIDHPPLISGERIPDYWCRQEMDGSVIFFLAQPLSVDLHYPIYSGQSLMTQSEFRDLTFTIHGKSISQHVEFKPYQSVVLRISPKGEIRYEDITFIPRDPLVRPREPQKTYF